MEQFQNPTDFSLKSVAIAPLGETKGYEIKQIDHSLVRFLPEYALEYWKNSEQFLREGFGYAVVRGTDLISSCWTFLSDRCVAELAVETKENF